MSYQQPDEQQPPPVVVHQQPIAYQPYPVHGTVYAVKPPIMPHAVWSFVLSIIAFLIPLLFFISAPLAITGVVLGHVGLSKIAKSAIPRGGRGLAIAGLVLGYLAIAASLLVLLFAASFKHAFDQGYQE